MKNYILIFIANIFISLNLYATDFGTKEEAENMLERAVNILKLDKSLGLELFAEGEGGFNYKDFILLLSRPTGHVPSPNFNWSKQKKRCRRCKCFGSNYQKRKEGSVNSVDIKIATNNG